MEMTLKPGFTAFGGSWAMAPKARQQAAEAPAVRAQPEKQPLSIETLAQMSLESLLYYVLAGDGRRTG
ncbi:MAG TPA: hypothetical protein VF865_10280 [Acidobacteriaceae bacterium]